MGRVLARTRTYSFHLEVTVNDPKAPALAVLLREAGWSWASADEVVSLLDRDPLPGCSSDDVAAGLYKWRAAGCRRALAGARQKASTLLRGDGSDDHINVDAVLPLGDADAEDQLSLFDASDERRRLAAHWPGK
jgi:hypothetical protein